MDALSKHFMQTKTGPQIGLFGDHWQTIYRGDFNLADFPNVYGINKGANFRSVPAIVNVLNKLRPDLTQEVSDPSAIGEAQFFHANSYTGKRTNTAHSKEDLPDGVSQSYTQALITKLKGSGWDFAPEKTKILKLTHNSLAAEQGYPTIASIFNRNEAFAKKEDPLIEFLADTLEPICRAFNAQKYGEMFHIIGRVPNLNMLADKTAWRADMDTLQLLRHEKTIGDVLDHLKTSCRPRLPDKIIWREEELEKAELEKTENEANLVTRYRQLRAVPYQEIIELVKYLDGETNFATQHSVKGAQFENVLLVLGGGWNHYNWPQFLETFETKQITNKNIKGFHRARNLFYVSISRPQKRLTVLATQNLSETAIAATIRLFGKDNVHNLNL